MALDGVGLAFGKVHLAILLVACRFADRDGLRPGQLLEELQQVGRILTGGVDVNPEVDAGMFLGQLPQRLLQVLVALTALDERQGLGGGLAVFPEEGGMMAVACGVEPHADGGTGGGGNHAAKLLGAATQGVTIPAVVSVLRESSDTISL